MVFLVSKAHEVILDQHLTKCQYNKTGEGFYVRNRYPDKQFPIYKLKIGTDDMGHNLLFTLTLETAPEKRMIKDEMIVFQKGTVIQEELARITQAFI